MSGPPYVLSRVFNDQVPSIFDMNWIFRGAFTLDTLRLMTWVVNLSSLFRLYVRDLTYIAFDSYSYRALRLGRPKP